MEITWLGHACFRLRGSKTTVVTDPYSPEIGYSLGKPQARIVTISHGHPGHAYFEGVGGEPKKVDRPGEYEIGGVMILGIAAFHDAESGARLGKNTIFTIEIDDLVVCHLGDLGHLLTSGQAEEIGGVDILLLPVGGVSTIDATAAARVVRQLDPKAVIPMHYKTPELVCPLEPVDNFLKEIGAKDTTPQPRLNFNRANLPATTQVFLLTPKGASA